MSNTRTPTAAKAKPATISGETAEFLLDLVNGITLTVNAPDFDDAVVKVVRARSELQEFLGITPE